MTQEDKKLLLRDLCARLPYGVKIYNGGIGKTLESMTIKPDFIEIIIKGTYAYCHFICENTGKWDTDDDLARCKPYLRPMSSMTDEERKEYELLANHCIVTSIGFVHLESAPLIDYLNAHHFDYRGLIPKGLAIKVTEENNPYKE